MPGSRSSFALCAALLTLYATNTLAGIQGVQVESPYLAAGGKTVAKVSLDSSTPVPEGAQLRITLLRVVDVPEHEDGVAGWREMVLPNKPVPAGIAKVPVDLNSDGILFGSLQVKAELLAEGNPVAVSTAWSAPVEVGVRPRISLAGAWEVVKTEPLEYEHKGRPKTWKAPPFDAPVTLPGAVTQDAWYRGWVTLQRKVQWAGTGAQPRFVRLSGVSNSALVRVNNQLVGETQPLEQLDCELSHWPEFHSQFKGPENKAKRQMMKDAEVLPPMTMALPSALPASGESTVEVTIRGTSGAFKQKPPYGIFGDLHLEATPDVFIKDVAFDTEKPGEKRRFRFQLTVVNAASAPFKGSLRTVVGRYESAQPYSGPCPAYANQQQEILLPPGESKIVVTRDETPRFDTCRATFLLTGQDNKVLDAAAQDFHTVVMEIRDRRDLYLNNERFFIKAQGSWGEDANSRLQLRSMGANAFRASQPIQSRLYPGLWSSADVINDRYSDGLLTSAGPLLASVEKCTFWDPQNPGNVTRAVQKVIRELAQCPGIVDWEATNELHGEPEEARVAILEAFHRLDPYHRPVLATKGSGEWEAESHEGRVAGVDIVGVQYLLSREATDSITAAVTEQPIMSTEVNWNDAALHGQNLWKIWLDKGISGSLLFDYSGRALQQPVPLLAPDTKSAAKGDILDFHRQLYQDFQATARRQPDGRIEVSFGNRMPYPLNDLVLRIQGGGRFDVPKLAPGDAVTLTLPENQTADDGKHVAARAEYTTHSGLKHFVLLTPAITLAQGEKKK